MIQNAISPCGWCGGIHTAVCPRVKSIEFQDDGVTVKRIEFVELHPLTAAPVQPLTDWSKRLSADRQPWVYFSNETGDAPVRAVSAPAA